MSYLVFLDQHLFFVINHLPHTALFNSIGLFLSGIGMLGIIWFILGAWLFFREEKRDHWFWAPIFLAAATSWLTVEVVAKPLIGRIRPSLGMGAIIIGSPSTDASFPSGHATIAFAMAVVLANKEPRWKWMFYLLAIAISFSRIYLGQHYPLDVIGGGILGWLLGSVVLFIQKKGNSLQK